MPLRLVFETILTENARANTRVSCLGFGNKRPNLGSAVANAEASVPNCVGLANVTINYGFRPYIIYENHRFVVEGNPIIKK